MKCRDKKGIIEPAKVDPFGYWTLPPGAAPYERYTCRDCPASLTVGVDEIHFRACGHPDHGGGWDEEPLCSRCYDLMVREQQLEKKDKDLEAREAAETVASLKAKVLALEGQLRPYKVAAKTLQGIRPRIENMADQCYTGELLTSNGWVLVLADIDRALKDLPIGTRLTAECTKCARRDTFHPAAIITTNPPLTLWRCDKCRHSATYHEDGRLASEGPL